VINEFAKLDVAGIWGDGQVVAVVNGLITR
jgi:hypothetical protein